MQDCGDYLSESGITSQLSAPGTPQQNGVAERREAYKQQLRARVAEAHAAEECGDKTEKYPPWTQGKTYAGLRVSRIMFQ